MELPKPYYTDGLRTLYHCDNRELLPLLSKHDLLLTDPPYGIGEGNQKRILSRGKVAFKKDGSKSNRKQFVAARDYGHTDWDKTPPERWVLELARSKARNSIVWGGNFFHLPPARGWFVWDKQNGASDFADCELAWTDLDKAVRIFRYRWAGMLQGNMKEKEIRKHPTQKPLPLMFWCLQHVPKAKTILDPWVGVGTVLRAAKDLGLSAIGIEIEERYCYEAAERLMQEALPLNTPEPPMPKDVDLFEV